VASLRANALWHGGCLVRTPAFQWRRCILSVTVCRCDHDAPATVNHSIYIKKSPGVSNENPFPGGLVVKTTTRLSPKGRQTLLPMAFLIDSLLGGFYIRTLISTGINIPRTQLRMTMGTSLISGNSRVLQSFLSKIENGLLWKRNT